MKLFLKNLLPAVGKAMRAFCYVVFVPLEIERF
jgi:hypothetical protein